jgi:enterochelin esterase-like enzyme/outer membrane protein assembly factor BamB
MRLRAARLGIILVSSLAAARAADGPATVEWSGLRGPGFDGAVRSARLFPAAGKSALAVGWKADLGSGYSGVAVAGGRVITMFATPESDVAAAFDAAMGKELWRYRIADAYKGHDGSHDGPISTPVQDAGRVFGLGPRGDLFALDAATGKALWSVNIVEKHGAKAPYYGFTTSPIVVDNVLVVEIGAGEGKAIAGFDPSDGRLIWSAGDDEISYHSPIAAVIAGRRMVLAAGKKTLLGIDPSTGKVLWSHAHQGDPQAMGGETIIPVPAGEGRFLLLNKIDASAMIEVKPAAGGTYTVSELWTNNSIRGTYVIPVYHDGHIYGMSGRIFTCVDAATGEVRWKSREPGDGFPTLVGDQLVIITKPGTLHVAAASPTGYQEVARLDLFGEQSWSSVAFAGGHLYARSMASLARIDPGEGAGPAGGKTWIARTEFGRFLEDVAGAQDKKSAVDAFLARHKSFPIVEETGAVHFIYRGEAKDVGIVGDMVGFRREDPMTRVPGTDLFHYSTRLEPDAAVSYGFLIDYGKPARDPLNERTSKGLFGEVSMLEMPARRSTEAPAAPQGPQGEMQSLEFESKVLAPKPDEDGKAAPAAKREVKVYLPPGYGKEPDRRYPVLYVQGAKDAIEQGGMKEALDRLVGSSAEPVIAVFLMPAENEPRGPGDPEQYAKMVATELVPLIDGRFRTLAFPEGRAAVGMGEGGTFALQIAFRNPDLFGKVGAHSPMVMNASELEPILKPADEAPLVIYLGWGTYHLRSPHEAWDMARGNRDLWTLLRQRGHRPTGGEIPEGFGWGFWKAHVDEMVATLFPRRQEAAATSAAKGGI